MMRQQRLSLTSLVLISLCVPFRVIGADDDAVKKEESAQRLADMKRSVEPVRITIGESEKEPLVRVDEPILRWSNPLIPIVDATVFLWTHNGRPALITQVAEVPREGLALEFQSLSTEPLRGQLREQPWAPVLGIKWLRAPTTEVPAATPVARLIQMRKIAERFQVLDIFEFKDPNQLRLIPKPLYRYAAPDFSVRDGALFSFALGTDPEVMMLVESQKVEGAEVWMIAFARLTGYACRVTLDNKEVWASYTLSHPIPASSPFMTLPWVRVNRSK
ncbi:MAG: hypothetical protein IAG10_09395 [Planctomycetaceae bacterium]|nr:hypothetical protein [Planctomycetaceae bacterium]